MMLTPDEYMAIMRLITSERESEGASLADRNKKPKAQRKSRKKGSNKYSRALSKALEEQNKLQKKVSGAYRKGKSAATIMQAAHKQVKKELGM